MLLNRVELGENRVIYYIIGLGILVRQLPGLPGLFRRPSTIIISFSNSDLNAHLKGTENVVKVVKKVGRGKVKDECNV